MSSLVLVRHGKSEWSNRNRFAGWADVPLSAAGAEEARRAGAALAERGLVFDSCHTSYLKRANQTLDIMLGAMQHPDLPVERSWRLNERHYGALQGENRARMALKHGNEQLIAWRRGYRDRPPALGDGDPRLAALDPLYAGVDPALLPRSESLEEAVRRVVPWWQERIEPQIRAGKRLLIVAHTSSLRGLARLIENLGDSETAAFKIPTAVPLVYGLDADLGVLDKLLLTDGWASRLRLLLNQHKPSSRISWV